MSDRTTSIVRMVPKPLENGRTECQWEDCQHAGPLVEFHGGHCERCFAFLAAVGGRDGDSYALPVAVRAGCLRHRFACICGAQMLLDVRPHTEGQQ